MTSALLGMVLVIATAGLVYELSMAAVASYVLGDSVRQFSLVIGVYLSALGLGAYLSRYIERDLALAFIQVELGTALLGGLSAPALFIAFSFGASFELLLLLVVTVVGTLVGIELPLLMRILESQLSFKDLIARALTFDYAGALLGSIGFSLYLVPKLGLVQTSIVCGLLNALVGLGSTWLLRKVSLNSDRQIMKVRLSAATVIVLLLAASALAPRLVAQGEERLLGGSGLTQDSAYQHIAVIHRDGALELYLNGHLQFSSRDECRYHEALVHPVMSLSPAPRNVFIGGGGDGLALREVLKWDSVQSVTLVDLDPAMTHLARTNPDLLRLNHGSLLDRRVVVRNEDAFQWVEKDPQKYDVLILDFPDPTTFGVGKLFTTTFYSRLHRIMTDNATIAVQSTSPFASNRSYWSIEETLAASGFRTAPLRVYLPSFGDWGYVLAKSKPFAPIFVLPSSVRLLCLSNSNLNALSAFPSDASRTQSAVNRLDNQLLVQVYLEESARFD